jgi:hypothetical protein
MCSESRIMIMKSGVGTRVYPHDDAVTLYPTSKGLGLQVLPSRLQYVLKFCYFTTSKYLDIYHL